jgi:hypothetical protein
MARITIPIVEGGTSVSHALDRLKAEKRGFIGVRIGKELKIVPAWELVQAHASGKESAGDVRGAIVYRGTTTKGFRTKAISTQASRGGLRVMTFGTDTVTIDAASGGIMRIANGAPRCVCLNPMRRPPHSYLPAEAERMKRLCVCGYEIVCP